ncbi:MAG: response regulator [Cyanobacteria bacterium J06621_11]
MVKILVIEDEMEIRANLLELLALEGYDIMGADNGVTGLIGALEFEPDLILCDVMMPELDGYDVLNALRQEPRTMLVPFIFLTAFADKGDIRQGMNLGADDYLTKPFTCAEVLDAVQTRLARRQLSSRTAELEQLQAHKLQREAKAFLDALDREKAALLTDVRKQMKYTVTKLNIANNILQMLPTSMERDQSIDMIQSVCNSGVKMLARVPNFEHVENFSDEPSVNTHSVMEKRGEGKKDEEKREDLIAG